MKARWQALAARYAGLNRREQIMVAAAVIVVVVMGGYTLWVEPASIRVATTAKQIAQQHQDAAALQPQLAELKALVTDPDAATKAALADVKAQLAALDRDGKAYENVLVPPRRVPQLLQSLLARHRGLDLIAMRTLAPVPLIERRPAKTAGAAETTGQAAPPPAAQRGANIFRHGLEIQVAGSYGDLLAYVAELERSPQKLLWENMSLVVKAHPRCELTLTIYTLSLDPTWLVVSS